MVSSVAKQARQWARAWPSKRIPGLGTEMSALTAGVAVEEPMQVEAAAGGSMMMMMARGGGVMIRAERQVRVC